MLSCESQRQFTGAVMDQDISNIITSISAATGEQQDQLFNQFIKV